MLAVKQKMRKASKTGANNEQDSDREVNTEGAVYPLVSQTQTNVTQTAKEQNVSGNSEISSTGVKLKTGQTVTFMKSDECVPYKAKILGRAGKATGQHKDWYNLQHIEPDGSYGRKEAVDMSRVDDLNIEPEVSNADVLITKDTVMMFLKKLKKCVSTRWVCSLKESDKGIVPKARLVARGFEEFNIQELQKDSPTCASESLRLLLTVICQNKWQVHSMDIKSAFLQGKELSKDIYVRSPPEAGSEGVLWKLKKCVYGFADASLYWYNKVKEIMLSTSGKVSQVDPAVLYWTDEQCKVTGVLACHVDDFLWGGSQNFSTDVIPQLKSAFHVGR